MTSWFSKTNPKPSRQLFLALGVCFISFGCGEKKTDKGVPSSAPTAVVHFTSATQKLQLKQIYGNGEGPLERAILETIGGGVAVADFDLDGFDDFYFAAGGELNDKKVTGLGGRYWRNLKGNTFSDQTIFVGANPTQLYTHAAIAGDINNDGFPDLLITGYQGLALYVNQGDGTFVEKTEQAGMTDTAWGTSCGFGDFNNDGSLDVYIAHYVDWSFNKHPACKSSGLPDVCAPGIFNALDDIIYMSQGDGTFVDRSKEMGLVKEGKGLGVMIADFTDDNFVDIYVANDTTNNFLYQNKGGTFEEVGIASGTAMDDMGTPEGSMGLCTLDYDGDLKSDIMVSNYENQAFALYKNDGDCNFRYVTASAGLMALGKTYVAWGTAAVDYDLDGDEDIVIANGHVMRANDPAQFPLYLVNLGNKKFQSQNFDTESYFSKKWRGRGVGAFDLERDGDIDLVFTHINEEAAVLVNETQTSGNWWIVELVGTVSNRDAIGARVHIKTSRRTLLRNVVGGGSYLSQNPYYIHWGLPSDETFEGLEVYWPSGHKQSVASWPAQSRTVVMETNQ